MPPPPGAVTVIAATAVCPEHTDVVPQSVRLGVTVTGLSSVAAFTVTVAVACLLSASSTVMVTGVSALTLAARSGMDPPVTACVTGSTVALLENAEYGGVPPLTVNAAGEPEKMVVVAGKRLSGGGGVAESA